MAIRLLTVPKRRVVFRVDDDLLPVSFKQDLTRYLGVMAGTDPLADDAPPRPLSPVSLAQYRRQILRFFGELIGCGLHSKTITNLKAMVRPENVEKGLRAMLARKGGSTSKTIYGIAYMLKTIAKHYVRLPAEEITKLNTICQRLRVRQVGMTEKNRKRLRQFDDEAQAARILHLPAELLAEARRGKLSPKRCAMMVEVALAIELLLMTALRIKNLAGLHLDQSIEFSRATRDGVCHLVVEAGQVKNGQHLEFELGDETTVLLRTFIDRYRSLLAPPTSRWLFSRREVSEPTSTTVLSHRISETIRDRTGLDVNPHLFRALGGKLYLDRHPGGYEVVRRMLGHTNMSTTLQAYMGLESTSAAKHFDNTIRTLRDGMAPRKYRRRTTHRNGIQP
jgi:integrase